MNPKLLRLNYLYRLSTGFLRVLPDVIIVGAQKGGTTSLYNYLIQHNAIHPANLDYSYLSKEIHYFSLYPFKSKQWYKSHFPFQLSKFFKKNVLNNEFISLEATPYYMYHPLAAKRIKKTIPKAKIIILLRDPVERAISHYYHNVSAGREPLEMMKAFTQYQNMVAAEHKKLMAKRNYSNIEHGFKSYLERGIYLPQIKSYHHVFGRKQVKIIHSHNLFNQPNDILKQVFEFIGISNMTVNNKKVYNQSLADKDVSDEALHFLSEYYKPHNQKLFEYLDQTFDWK